MPIFLPAGFNNKTLIILYLFSQNFRRTTSLIFCDRTNIFWSAGASAYRSYRYCVCQSYLESFYRSYFISSNAILAKHILKKLLRFKPVTRGNLRFKKGLFHYTHESFFIEMVLLNYCVSFNLR